MTTNNFDKTNYHWRNDINYRKYPEKYRVGKGEQGVLLCEPYKSEILPYWHFKTPAEAKKSSIAIYKLFKHYLERKEFIGGDMARKFLQMGFTRARRYTNYKGGKKYNSADHSLLEKGTGDPEKAISAEIFYKKWQLAEHNILYKKLKQDWKKTYG